MAASRKRDFALVVGVAKYASSNTYSDLEGPPVDCRDFREWLISDAGVPAAQIETVVWSPTATPPYPDYSDVWQALERLLFPPQKRTPRSGRRLYLFSAGHCEAPGDLDADVITADAGRIRSEPFPLTRVANRVRRSGLFREIVVFIDGCRTPPMTEVQPFVLDLPPGDASAVASVRYLTAFATQFNQLAFEAKIDDTVRGVFSYALLEALRGGARDDKGFVTDRSLDLHLRRRVPDLRSEDTEQVPEVYCPAGLRLI